MIPSRLFEIIASSEESTIAASRNREELSIRRGGMCTQVLGTGSILSKPQKPHTGFLVKRIPKGSRRSELRFMRLPKVATASPEVAAITVTIAE
jgi:hypothetical protein